VFVLGLLVATVVLFPSLIASMKALSSSALLHLTRRDADPVHVNGTLVVSAGLLQLSLQ
jgi:hypothetical protein